MPQMNCTDLLLKLNSKKHKMYFNLVKVGTHAVIDAVIDVGLQSSSHLINL